MNSDLHHLIAQARWFGGKGQPFTLTAVDAVGSVGPGPVTADAWVATLDYGTTTDRYLLWSPGSAEPSGTAMPDLTTSEAGLQALWAGFQGQTTGPIRCRALAPLPTVATAAPLAVEQSNTSIRFGDRWLLKLFRRFSPGVNPDIELHEVLTRAGSRDIATLGGWIEAEIDGVGTHLGILQEFLPGALDGWGIALASLRPGGEDFTAHSAAIGAALSRVHRLLATHTPGPATSGMDLALAMTARLHAAADIVPGLDEHRRSLTALFDRVRDIAVIGTHRIHGDFHLGQTLHSGGGWRLVDFEGEPAASPEQRVRPDSGWRDLAGMRRSFDYATAVAARSAADPGGLAEAATTYLEEWREQQGRAFLHGYLGRAPTSEERLLLDAYTADKAVYETVYETRHRPDWVNIPLGALAQIGAR